MGRQQVPVRFLAPVMVLQETNPELYKELNDTFDLGDLTQEYDRTIEIGLYRRIISWFYDQTQNRSLGFGIGLKSAMNATGPIGIYVSGCESLSKALRELQVYYPIVETDDSIMTVEPHEKGLVVEVSGFKFESIVDVYAKDTLLGRMIRLCNRVAGPEFFPEVIGYPESEFGRPENLEDFAKQIVTTQNKLMLFFSDETANRPALYANTEILKLLKPRLDEELEQINRVDSLLVQIRKYLGSLESLKDVTQASIASHFNMSLSSLRRRLTDHDSSFSEFFQRYRRNKSLDLLSNAEIKLDIVAEMLGFSERASFERAFRQWFNTTPAKFREQMGVFSAKSLDSLDVNQLPSSPKSCSQILDLLEQEGFTIGQLVDLVSLDPLLSAKVMAISRSAFYGARNIKNLNDAITKVLGVEQVRYLALITASNSSFAADLPKSFSLEGYWQTALLTANYLTRLEPLSKTSLRFDANEFYLIGLFFNIGAFMLASLYPEETEELLKVYPELKTQKEVRKFEVETFGTTVYSAGALLIAHWDLPKPVFSTVKELDEPEGSTKLSTEASLVKACAKFSFLYYPKRENDGAKQEFLKEINTLLGVNEVAANKLIDSQNMKFEELSQMIKELIK